MENIEPEGRAQCFQTLLHKANPLSEECPRTNKGYTSLVGYFYFVITACIGNTDGDEGNENQ